MKKLIIILFLFCSYLSFAQGEEGRAITGRIQIDVGKIDTLYFTNDTLYLTEDGILFKTEIAGSGGDGYVSSATFNTGNGIITLNDPVNGAKTVDIDGRYGQLGANNTWSGVQTFNGNIDANGTIDIFGTTGQLYFKYLSTFQGEITATSSGMTLTGGDAGNYVRLLSPDNSNKVQVDNDGVFMELDAETQTDVLYRNPSTGEITYGTASSGSSFLGVKAYATTTQNITANTPATITFPSEDYDTGNDFASNTFVAPETGYYRITVNVRVTTGGTNPTYVSINFVGVSERSAFTWSNQDVLQQNYIATETFYITASANVYVDIDVNENCTIGSRSICIEKL